MQLLHMENKYIDKEFMFETREELKILIYNTFTSIPKHQE